MIMPASVPPPATETVTVPAHKLRPSRKNVRRTNRGRNIPALADSILKEGLLQNLVVSRHRDTYPVEAGERRRLAIAYLVKKRKIPRDWPVPVRFVDADDSTSASLTENLFRERMHPADEFAAFVDLTRQGWTIDRIADHFGVTPLVVERRLTLARAAPPLLEMYRADQVTTEQLMALCATDDHERQVAAWRDAPSDFYRQPSHLRRSVVSGEADVTSDSRIAFIGGVDAFLAAGGEVRRDLFSVDGAGGFITDVGLLEQLVARKLEEAAEGVRKEGWGWVQVWPEWDWIEFNRLGRIHKTAFALSADAEARIEALHAEREALSDESDEITGNSEGEDLPDAEGERLETIWARLSEIDNESRAIHLAHQAFDPEAVPAAGAIVGMDGGRFRVERGLVRTADRTRVQETGAGTTTVSGGRVSEVSGRKAGALSDTLTRSLLGYRNLAAQSTTAGNTHVAKVLLACWIVQRIRTRDHAVPVDLRITEMGSGTRTQHPIADEEGAVLRKAFDGIGTGLIATLPTEDGALWDALMQLPADEIDRLIAFAVASSVSLSTSHTGLTEKLLTALGFDMADRFTATAANYLGRVSKAQIVDALAEAGKVTDEVQRGMLAALKKADLAARAEAELATTRWVPSLIRTPMVKPPTKARKRKASGAGDAAKPVKGRAAGDSKAGTDSASRRRRSRARDEAGTSSTPGKTPRTSRAEETAPVLRRRRTPARDEAGTASAAGTSRRRSHATGGTDTAPPVDISPAAPVVSPAAPPVDISPEDPPSAESPSLQPIAA